MLDRAPGYFFFFSDQNSKFGLMLSPNTGGMPSEPGPTEDEIERLRERYQEAFASHTSSDATGSSA